MMKRETDRPTKPEGTRRLTASERESLLRLNVAHDILVQEPQHLQARSALVPGARRDLAMIAARIRTLMEGYTRTIPDDQMRTYVNSLVMASYVIGVRRPGGAERDEREYGMWLPFAVLNELLGGCHDHCTMCNLDVTGRRACTLRRALDTIPNDVPQREDGECPYFTVI